MRKVLIVDDDTRIIQTLGSLLREEASVTLATSGEDAMMIAKANKPDLILLDVAMPGMDGFAVCGKLKNDPQTKSIPVIFIAAEDDGHDQTRGFELGAVDYVTKPFNLPIIAAKVKSLLAHLPASTVNGSADSRRRGADAPRKAEGNGRRAVEGGCRRAGKNDRSSLKNRLLSRQTGKIAAVAALLLFAGIGYGKYFKDSPAPPDAPQSRSYIPAKPDSPGRASSVDWVKNTSCGAIPKVSWWGTLTHKNMVEYVNQRHAGDWAPYIAKWEQQLVLMKDILSRDGTAKTKDGALLQGKELEAHIADLKTRVDVAVCLAGEAAVAKSR
ncbi:MAG: hypothetical protein A3G18_12955 [Rhodospirillales bacterium RIFCSPLOWO2_12_FULL_58_28]|nr:MAG: hypothetical protein A3H92_12810 [Rhodospirillales bacterium RIFCSPLOWO2_02_FULL_58_16]OHC78493.1 MAG: hypothetical protein A3G18_12955 [Rhodospirillales bacterium RIFCSPLOWO2_12_FULL_58_28]